MHFTHADFSYPSSAINTVIIVYSSKFVCSKTKPRGDESPSHLLKVAFSMSEFHLYSLKLIRSSAVSSLFLKAMTLQLA